MIEQKGMHLNHDFYGVVGKQCRTKNTEKEHKLIYIKILYW